VFGSLLQAQSVQSTRSLTITTGSNGSSFLLHKLRQNFEIATLMDIDPFHQQPGNPRASTNKGGVVHQAFARMKAGPYIMHDRVDDRMESSKEKNMISSLF